MDSTPQTNKTPTHSKGPWRVSRQGRSRILIRKSAGEVICQVMAGAVGDKQAGANSKLIAAAPDMLDALHSAAEQLLILNNIYNFTSGDAEVNAEIAAKGIAAIVKAGGEVPETFEQADAADSPYTGGALR